MPKNVSEFIATQKEAIDKLSFKISPEAINRLIQETTAEINKRNEYIQNAASLKFGNINEWIEADCGHCLNWSAEFSVLHKHTDILAYTSKISISLSKEKNKNTSYKRGKFYSFFHALNIFGKIDVQIPNHFTKKQATREKVLAYAEKVLRDFFI